MFGRNFYQSSGIGKSDKRKRKWAANKIETNPNSYKEFIEVSLFLGQSLEGIGKRINLSYNKILTYCQEEGLLNKHKNRS